MVTIAQYHHKVAVCTNNWCISVFSSYTFSVSPCISASLHPASRSVPHMRYPKYTETIWKHPHRTGDIP